MASDTTNYEVYSSTQKDTDNIYRCLETYIERIYGIREKTASYNSKIIPFFPFVKPTIISFTLSGSFLVAGSYEGIEGITWERWCQSKWNKYSLGISGGKVVDGGGSCYIKDVESSDVIENGANYELASNM